jgi:hypothetical protein
LSIPSSAWLPDALELALPCAHSILFATQPFMELRFIPLRIGNAEKTLDSRRNGPIYTPHHRIWRSRRHRPWCGTVRHVPASDSRAEPARIPQLGIVKLRPIGAFEGNDRVGLIGWRSVFAARNDTSMISHFNRWRISAQLDNAWKAVGTGSAHRNPLTRIRLIFLPHRIFTAHAHPGPPAQRAMWSPPLVRIG